MPRPHPATPRVAHHFEDMPRPDPAVLRRATADEAWPRPYARSLSKTFLQEQKWPRRSPRPEGEGQDGPSQSAKRTAVQTVTWGTGQIIMSINKLLAGKSELVKYRDSLQSPHARRLRYTSRLTASRTQTLTKFSKQVGENRYRETFGRYFEDFSVGDVYEHRPGKTITEADNHFFTLLTMNTHPIHFDAEYAKSSEFGKNLVVSPYTLALLIGMSVSDISQKAIANLGMDEVKFTAPVFVGDTLYSESEVLEKRESKSRPGQGIVTIRTIGKNQNDQVVCSFLRSALVPARGEAVDDRNPRY